MLSLGFSASLRGSWPLGNKSVLSAHVPQCLGNCLWGIIPLSGWTLPSELHTLTYENQQLVMQQQQPHTSHKAHQRMRSAHCVPWTLPLDQFHPHNDGWCRCHPMRWPTCLGSYKYLLIIKLFLCVCSVANFLFPKQCASFQQLLVFDFVYV